MSKDMQDTFRSMGPPYISITSLLKGVLTLLVAVHAGVKPATPARAVGQSGRGLSHRPLPFAGTGTCEQPIERVGLTSVRCLGPEMPMLPGQTIDAYILLASPYPSNKNVTVTRQEAQMVAKVGPGAWRPVPLSELYFHHVVPNPRFLLGEGAEVRGSRIRKQLHKPYAFVVNGEEAADHDTRMTNLQLVNTIGVPADHIQNSIECWCGTEQFREESTRGSLFCCKQSPTNSTAGLQYYQLEYNVTYRDVAEDEQPVRFFGYDVTGGQIEYNIVHPLGPNTNHTKAIETEVDKNCPQEEAFEIIRCTAHQHVGSVCMHVYNAEDGDLICSSCTIYGKQKDEPGNELGYVVAIQDDDLATPYKIKPGTRIRVESVYEGSQKRLGVMGIMAIWVSGLTKECGPFSSATPMSMMRTLQEPGAVVESF